MQIAIYYTYYLNTNIKYILFNGLFLYECSILKKSDVSKKPKMKDILDWAHLSSGYKPEIIKGEKNKLFKHIKIAFKYTYFSIVLVAILTLKTL